MAFLYINMKVAILIDGSFFLKRAQSAIPNFEPDPDKTANLIVSYAMRHVEHYKDDSKDDDTKSAQVYIGYFTMIALPSPRRLTIRFLRKL